MNSEESNKLDNLIKAKLNTHPYPFEEDDATKALQALKKSRRSKLLKWTIPALAILLFMGISFLFLGKDQAKTLVSIAESKNLSKKESQTSNRPENSNKSGNSKSQVPETNSDIEPNSAIQKVSKPNNQELNQSDVSLKTKEITTHNKQKSTPQNIEFTTNNSDETNSLAGQQESTLNSISASEPGLLNSKGILQLKTKAFDLPGLKEIPKLKPRKNWTPSFSFGIAGEINKHQEWTLQSEALMQFKPKGPISFYSGFGYTQTFGKLAPRTYVQNRYGYEKEETKITLDTRKLEYLGIPLGIGIDAGNRHQFSGGLRYLVLINSWERETKKVNGQLVSVETRRGFNQPFNQKDILFELAYSYRILPGIRIQAMTYRGLQAQGTKMYSENKSVFNQGWRLGILWQVR